MVSIATKIMWHVNFNIFNQHTKFGDIQTKIYKITVKSCTFHYNTLKYTKIALTHLWCYAAKSLNKNQWNYIVSEMELLAIIFSLKQYSMFLRFHPYTIITDHRSLSWLLNIDDPKSRLATWLEYLGQFQYTIVHKPRKTHKNASTLSRMPLTDTGHFDGDNIIAITDGTFTRKSKLNPEKKFAQRYNHNHRFFGTRWFKVGLITRWWLQKHL